MLPATTVHALPSADTSLQLWGQWCLLAVFVFLLLCLPKSFWKIGKALKDDGKKTAENKKKEAQARERDIVEKLLATDGWQDSNVAREYLITKVSNAISYAINRHDWYEDQRARVFQASLTLLSAVLAGLAIVANTEVIHVELLQRITIFTGVIAGIAVLKMVYLYNKELDADRPYRLLSDIRFWYFRYNLPEASLKHRTAEIEKVASQVSSERKRFFERIAPNFELGESLREDLEQIFILQTLQRYKSESLKRMRWVLSYFLIFGAIQAVWFTIAALK